MAELRGRANEQTDSRALFQANRAIRSTDPETRTTEAGVPAFMDAQTEGDAMSLYQDEYLNQSATAKAYRFFMRLIRWLRG